MSEYTPITNELRKYVADNRAVYITPFAAKCLIGIADRIDAEHEKAMIRAGQLLDDAEKERDCNYANWQECKQKVLQGNITIDELNARVECLEDELSHCITKDADGEYIHIGDVMENTICPSVHREVTAVGVECFYGWDEGNGCYSQFSANRYRHHKPDTWERIIKDAIDAVDDCWANDEHDKLVDALVARCKKLAGDAE